ncbi:MAG: DUF3187 family protein [Thermoanaerobaculia bacterium]
MNWVLRTVLIVVWLALAAAGRVSARPPEAGGTGPERPPGPIPLRIVAPVHGLFYQLTPASAAPLEADRSTLRLELSESNVLHCCATTEPPFFRPTVDLEITRLQIAYRRGLGGGWQLGVEVPLFYYHEGFLDGLIYGTERLFGKTKPRREAERRDRYTYEIRRGDDVLFQGPRAEPGLGNMALTFTRRLWTQDGRRPGLAVRGGLSVPTGDRDRAFGSGIVEAALGVAAEWHRGRWTLNGGGAFTLPLDQVDETPGFTNVPVLAGYLEAAHTLGPRAAVHLQVAAQTGPFRAQGGPPLDTPLPRKHKRGLTHHIVQLSPAVSWRLDADRTLYLGFVQDFIESGDSAADATVFATLSWGLP